MRARLPLLILLLLSTLVRAAPAPATPEMVDAMIEKGKAWIYGEQKANGTWERAAAPPTPLVNDQNETSGQWGGQTAMAVYTLLSCGEKSTSPKLANAIEYLKKANITGTYALAMRCMVWLNMPDTQEIKLLMRRDAIALANSMHEVKPDKSRKTTLKLFAWDYTPLGKGFSMSRSQYGAQGLRAAAELNIEVPAVAWQNVENLWKYAQVDDGGWCYNFSPDDKQPTTVNLTAAAIATLVNVQEFTMANAFNDTRGNYHDPSIEKGLAFLEKMWADRVCIDHDSRREFPYSQLYALERVGLATGLRKIGDNDWYGQGSLWLAGHQGKPGNFSGGNGHGDFANTCFSLLFLQRGRTPVAFNKLDYSSGSTDPKKADYWNQRPRDVAKLTRYISRNLERELRWQIVTLDDSNDAFLEAPVLWISGSEELSLKPDAKAKLKRYLDLGGLIVGLADGNSSRFASSFQKLGAEFYKENEWRDLPATHPILTSQVFKADKNAARPTVKALGNEVRELMILLPTGDLSRTFQIGSISTRPEQWQFMANLLAYSVNKSDFRRRGDTNLVVAKAAQPNRTLKVGHLIYSGPWNPEPATWEMANRLAQNARSLKLEVSSIKASDTLDGYQLLYLGGTRGFQLDDAAREHLKAYLDQGGLLLVDSLGGSDAFAASAQKELASILPQGELKPIPLSHALVKDIKPDYRTYASKLGIDTAGFNLSMIELKGRPAVIFSRADLATGVIGFSHDGIPGLTPASAREVLLRVLDAAATKPK